MLDLKLDPETWDVVLEGGDLVWVMGDEELVQHIGIQLKTIVREWFLDPLLGFLDLKRMFGKGASEGYFRAKLIAKVESNEEVSKGSAVIESLTATGRSRRVVWAARKVNGNPIRGRVSLRVP